MCSPLIAEVHPDDVAVLLGAEQLLRSAAGLGLPIVNEARPFAVSGRSSENREIGTYLGVTKQERALVEPFALQPSGDLVVALAGVARATSRYHVPERVTTAARDGQNAVALKRPLRGAALRAPSRACCRAVHWASVRS